MANRDEIRSFIKIARQHGWTIEQTKACHYRWTSPTGDFFFSSGTPSDWRGLERLKQDLRRRGLDLRKVKQR